MFTAVGAYDLGNGFEAGLRFRFATGYPRTPVIGVCSGNQVACKQVVGQYHDLSNDTYEPVFGAHNSIRIPPFVSLDVRFAKRFKLGNKTELEVYLDVQNVTNHSNPRGGRLQTFDVHAARVHHRSFPILPVLGARLSW